MRIIVGCFGALLTLATPLHAQDVERPRPFARSTLLGANAVAGALTAVIGQAFRDDKINVKTIAQGALGGAIVYGGKAIVAENVWLLNLLGRQVAAVGSSGIQNVAAGRGFTQRLSLPYGPVRVNIETGRRPTVRLKVDVARAVILGAVLSDVHRDMQVGQSILYGVPVFRDDRPVTDTVWTGSHVGGVVTYRERAVNGLTNRQATRLNVAHELVHVVQADFSYNTWGAPLERAFIGESKIGRVFYVYFDLGLDVPLASLVNSMVSYQSRPWEREAVSLVRQR